MLHILCDNAVVVVEHSTIASAVRLALSFLLSIITAMSNGHISTNLAIGAVKSAVKLPQAILYTLKTCIKSTGKSQMALNFCNVPLSRTVRFGANKCTSGCYFCIVITVSCHIEISTMQLKIDNITRHKQQYDALVHLQLCVYRSVHDSNTIQHTQRQNVT